MGGLGDWLVNSTLPELFSKQGDVVYLSSKSYESVKNTQTLDLMLCCPYIKDISDLDFNIGVGDFNSIINLRGDNLTVNDWGDLRYNILYAREYINNFDPKNSNPIIYYQPKFRKEFMDKVVVDFNTISSSNAYDWDVVKKFIVSNSEWVYLNLQPSDFEYNTHYKTKDIFEYIDILYSCKKFICTISGSNTLVSAVSRFRVKLDVDVYLPDSLTLENVNQWLFRFPNNNYKHF